MEGPAEGTNTVKMVSWEQIDRERTDISCYFTHIRVVGSFIFYRLIDNFSIYQLKCEVLHGCITYTV